VCYPARAMEPASMTSGATVGGLELDEGIESLARKQAEWRRKSPREKAGVARTVLASLESLSWSDAKWNGTPWAEGQLVLEGYDAKANCRDSHAKAHAASQKMIFGLVIKRYLQKVIKELSEGGSGSERPAKKVGAYDVFPCDALTVPKVAGEAWCLPSSGSPEGRKTAPEGVCLVLGAGNQNFLSMIDVLDRLFMHDQVVILKHHPLRPFLFAPYASILRPLTDAGLVHQVQDQGVEFSQMICGHSLVDHIHVTGSGATHDAICKTLERAGRQSDVEITCELGCVTPWIVSNGSWTKKEIAFQSKTLAFSKKFGGGANCLSPQVLIVDNDWPQLGSFLDSLKGSLRSLPTPPAYYPGASKRLDALCSQYADSQVESVAGTPHPSTLSTSGTSTKPLLSVQLLDCGLHGDDGFNDAALKTEAFAPVLSIVRVKAGNDTRRFLRQAVNIANEECEGSLSCSVSCPGAVAEGSSFNDVLADLKFGSVGVNCSTTFGYVATTAGGGWGAYPGLYSKDDCGSGNGYIGNIGNRLGYAKTVVKSPSVNSFADISQVPPALISEILCSCFLSSGTLQGAGRAFSVLVKALVKAFAGLFSSSNASRGGYKRIE